MNDDSEQWPAARPRWGTFSVRSHLDLNQLISDLLLYDVLVFPCPEDEDDFDRWEDNHWQPERLALRCTQLGDHAVVVPWDKGLRREWERRYNERLPAMLSEDPPAKSDHMPYLLTQEVLAELSFVTLMGEEDDRFDEMVLNPPEVHPAFANSDARQRVHRETLELVAAFPDSADLFEYQGMPGDQEEALRLALPLQIPEGDDEAALRRAIDLVEKDSFIQARRRLWAWESELPPNLSADDVATCLRSLLRDYNRVVEQASAASRRETIFEFVPLLVNLALPGIAGDLAGIGLERVRGRFPKLAGKAGRASYHPGAAVAGMLSVIAR